MMKSSALLAAVLMALQGCSFGDRHIHLRIDPPAGDPAVPRGISVVLEEPEDARPEPHDVVGAVRSGVGVKTADITSDDDVVAWVRQAMTLELQHAGFVVAPAANPGRALRIATRIRTLSCEEGIGFGATISLDIRITGDRRVLLQRTYQAKDHHVVVTKTSGEPADALRTCLRRIVSALVKDLVAIVENAP